METVRSKYVHIVSFVFVICFLVHGSAIATDCNSNGIPDENEINAVYAGTQGGLSGGGGGMVFKYTGGTNWTNLTPTPTWDVSAVMDLAYSSDWIGHDNFVSRWAGKPENNH